MTPAGWLRLSVLVAVTTIALKAGAWWITGSVSLLSDALEALVNLAGASFALWMVTVAEQPPDAEHPHGHHKAEYFSSGFEGLLILAAAAAILVAAAERLWRPQPLGDLGWGIALSVLSSILNGALAVGMLRQARRHRSMALEGDARHLMTDVWTTAGVIVGLGLATLTGWHWLDPVLAIAVALHIVREGLKMLRRSADGLMDHALEPEVLAAVQRTLAGFEAQVVRFDHVVTRRAGARRFVDLHLHLPGDWTLQRAAALRLDVEDALRAAVPGLRATIELLPAQVEPLPPDDRPAHDTAPGGAPAA